MAAPAKAPESLAYDRDTEMNYSMGPFEMRGYQMFGKLETDGDALKGEEFPSHVKKEVINSIYADRAERTQIYNAEKEVERQRAVIEARNASRGS